MPRTPSIKVGDKQGYLTVIGKEERHLWKYAQTTWLCVCDCGSKVSVGNGNLKSGSTVSCGCQKGALNGHAHRTHGLTKTPEYKAWQSMHQRVLNRNCRNYKNYGERGIRTSDEWVSFEQFLLDMGPKPSSLHSLDRIDNEGPYSKENCRWSTAKEQSRNRRVTVFITVEGQERPAAEWCEIYGVTYSTYTSRVHALGWDKVRAVTTPIRGLKNKDTKCEKY